MRFFILFVLSFYCSQFNFEQRMHIRCRDGVNKKNISIEWRSVDAAAKRMNILSKLKD